MGSDIVVSHAADRIASITLNRPDKNNPLSAEMCEALIAAFRAAAKDDRVRVIVLGGAGRSFSAGGDLAAIAQSIDAGARAHAPPDLSFLATLFSTMHGLGKPIIAKVGGAAFGGGLGLVAACDLAVASADAAFALPEISIGVWPMIVAAEITRNVGRKKTLEMMLTGAKLTAPDALACGLINRVVPPHDLESATAELAGAIAERSPATMRLGLKAFYGSQDLPYPEQLALLTQELGAVLGLEDAREGITAFLQKRAPVWQGK